MATITIPGMFLTGNHASRPSSGVGKGTLYACSTHNKIYQTTDTGSTWVDWFVAGGDAVLPWHVSIVPMLWTPDATTGTWGLTGFSDASTTYPFVKTGATPNESATGFFNSSSAQNDAASWDVVLGAGTWDAHFYARKASNAAIITLNQDGSSQGTVDTYAASATYAKVSITGWTVSTSGKHTMQVKAATKNGSSSNYLIELFGIEFRRTA